MRIGRFVVLCGISLQLLSTRSFAHWDSIGILVSVEKTYAAPKPIGHIIVRYDAIDDKNPKLTLKNDLFSVGLPVQSFNHLPGPGWNDMVVGHSLSSFDEKTRKLVNRPYLFIDVPLFGLKGKDFTQPQVLFFFNDKGLFTKRILKKFVPIKDHRICLEAETGKSDYIETIYENWPLTSKETAESVISRALEKIQTRLKNNS